MSWLTREIIPSRRGALSTRLTVLLSVGTMLTSLALWSPARLGVVTGHSMEPTLQPGHPFVYVREKQGRQQYQAGEVVVVHMGGDICVKRIFRVGGERFWTLRISPESDRMSISPLDAEPSIDAWRKRYPRFKFTRYEVPEGTLFLLGDSPWSSDSRQLGPVPVENVVGRVVAPFTPEPEVKPYTSWTNRPNRRLQRAGRRLATEV